MALLKPGALFNERYRIESLLGEGGFAIVYAAVDNDSGRWVALKLLKPSDAAHAREDRARFEREARLAGKLRSRHVARMYECGEDTSGQMFTAFELVEGEDLSTALARHGRLDQRVARDVLRQVLEALDEAHRQGLVHRDVKPENIRVTPDAGRPDRLCATLLDFGIARATAAGHPSITRTGELIGTPRYMSPEQLTGKPLTAASDIYSLGVVLFEMLAGRDALPGGSLGAQIERMVEGHVFDSPELAGVDGALVELMRKMTVPHVPGRYGSAAAILSDLRGESDRVAPLPAEKLATGKWTVAAAASAVIAAGIAFVSPNDEPAPRVQANAAARELGSIVRGKDSATTPKHTTQPDLGATDVRDATPDPPAVPAMVWGDSGCGKPLDHASISTDRLKSWVPKGYRASRRHPLVVLLHGDLEGAGNFVHEAHFDTTSDAEGFIFVVPFAGAEPWRDMATSRAHVHETVQLVDRTACIDRERVYLIGNREGGFAALPLSCEPWVRATAIASLGVPADAEHQLLSCPTPAPTLWFQPSVAPRVPRLGGVDCEQRERLPLDAVIDSFRQRGACKSEPKTTVSRKDGVCRAYDCDTAFELCEVDGGPFWPGQEQRAHAWALTSLLGSACKSGPAPTFPMLDVAWRFFDTQPTRAR